MSRALERRLEKLERPDSGEATIEDWLDVLDAPDQDAALADLNRRFPGGAAAGVLAVLD